MTNEERMVLRERIKEIRARAQAIGEILVQLEGKTRELQHALQERTALNALSELSRTDTAASRS